MAKASEKTKAAPEATATAKPKAGSKPNALQQPLQPSEDLAAIIGEGRLHEGKWPAKSGRIFWAYIKAQKLQSPDDGRQILADAKLEKVLGRKSVTMCEMNKLLSPHLKSTS